MLKDKIQETILPVLDAMGFELFDLQIKSSLIQIFIDRESGISIEDCAQVNRHVMRLLESLPEFSGRFGIEVSSPGAERPLRNIKDFEKYKGKKVKIKIREDVTGNTRTLRGVIGDVAEKEIGLISDAGVELVEYRCILKANLAV